ncbi:phosphatase dcr2 [Niveomyces insectorum RCEF 264]|uniref:Phosphatase dcr2 n=1 Tax=Niveomyces insectorum RCEF 264 TaxID=1081102 RepID=A0A167X3T3_9HYPO|nr:phosphatase dcr2 [Niveomyces insectorum RCEF 264]
MARRIVRTALQVSAVGILTLIVLFVLDRNYRVLPNALHEYLPQHYHGLVVTDIRITRCSSLNVFSSCTLDGGSGGGGGGGDLWHRIEKDLYLGKSMSHGYVHVQRKKEQDLLPEDQVVVDVAVGRLDPGASAKGQAKAKAGAEGEAETGDDERWESRGSGLWVKRTERKHVGDTSHAVAAVDVLFGDDAVEAREGWAIKGTPLLLDGGSSIPAAHLTVRKGGRHETAKPQPRIHDNGRFKIVQLADLHLSTGVGACRDAVPNTYNGGRCEADPRTLDFVTKVLDDERPDLVVLSGDQVNGETAPDAQSAIFKYAHLLIQRKIPYVTIFGNHDDEGSLPRASQMALIESLPYSLSRAGPDTVDGVGNYVVEVLARGGSSHSALTLYLLDTHAYSPDERKYKGYDWIKPNQIDWFRHTAQGLKKNHKEYTHVHMDVAFIHIPLPEYREPDQYYKGEWKEPPTAPVYNSNFRDALVEEGVVMVSCGHDHVNEYCALSVNEKNLPALWMCYGGGAGFGGYGGYGDFIRKIRVFDFDMNEGRISTWKRAEHGDADKKLDVQIIVDAGKPVAPPPEE